MGIQARAVTPLGFYVVRDGKPEELAAAAASLFLGVRLECARCHNHPFAPWTREQFWGLAAFFAGVRGSASDSASPIREATKRELAIPQTDQVVRASLLDGSEPNWRAGVVSCAVLAEWVTDPENPYFARAAVNRLWAELFGLGLVEPVDDMLAANAPSHPVLLDELASQFVLHRYDLKYLIRAVTQTRTYQLSSAGSAPSDARLFSRMPVKGLTPEQLYDSVVQATGYRPRQPDGDREVRRAFLVQFGSRERQTETRTTLPQALSMMNGRPIAEATSPTRGATLAAVIASPFMDDAGRIETLFLATLSRAPRADELERLLRHVAGGCKSGDRGEAFGDIFWALLNSAEFVLNH